MGKEKRVKKFLRKEVKLIDAPEKRMNSQEFGEKRNRPYMKRRKLEFNDANDDPDGTGHIANATDDTGDVANAPDDTGVVAELTKALGEFKLK